MVSHQWRKCIPRPEGNHETEPSKEEDAAVDIDWVEEGYRPGLSVDGVDFRARNQARQGNTRGPHFSSNVCDEKRWPKKAALTMADGSDAWTDLPEHKWLRAVFHVASIMP